MQPLDGIRVLDLGTFIAGPFCATVLGEFGADVIKVERPGTGDHLRRFGTETECGDTFVWLSEGRNKRSITLDLSTPAGRGAPRRADQRVRRRRRELPTRRDGALGSRPRGHRGAQPRGHPRADLGVRADRTQPATCPASPASPTGSPASPTSPGRPTDHRSPRARRRWPTTSPGSTAWSGPCSPCGPGRPPAGARSSTSRCSSRSSGCSTSWRRRSSSSASSGSGWAPTR